MDNGRSRGIAQVRGLYGLPPTRPLGPRTRLLRCQRIAVAGRLPKAEQPLAPLLPLSNLGRKSAGLRRVAPVLRPIGDRPCKAPRSRLTCPARIGSGLG